MDKNDIFRLPVTRAEAPDYYDIIKNPMCFSAIEVKIDSGDYLDLESFKVFRYRTRSPLPLLITYTGRHKSSLRERDGLQ